MEARDAWSHPEGAPNVDWISWAYGCLGDCSLLINRMWVRVTHPERSVWEQGFRKKPQWAQPKA